MGSPTAIEIAPISTPLPTCSPNLMPFHIDYSGPAPISTYFRVKPGPSCVAAPDAIVADTPTAEPGLQDAGTTSSEDCVAGDTTRFVAAFRGRTVHGLKVDLPEGYGGVVLRADGGDNPRAGKGPTAKSVEARGKLKASRKGRITRNSIRATGVQGGGSGDDVMDGTGVSAEDAGDLVDEEAAARALQASAAFSSFVLWQADIPVNEAKDEYVRSLTEWTRLASHIHKFEES